MNQTKLDEEETPASDRRQKVQSVEVGMSLLIALSRAGAATTLSRLAQMTDMPASKAHRYMKALIESGIVMQEEASGLYRLGPEALAIGFAAIREMDVASVSARPLAQLRDRIDETCMLAVWSNHGPAVVRMEPASGSVVINIRLGSILPLLISATGQIFSAYQDDKQTAHLIKRERADLLKQGKRDLVVQAETSIVQARQTGLACVKSTLTPGVSAIAAPVFDHQGQLAGVFASMGPTGYFNEALDGPIARELLAAASETSEYLGRPRTR
jgi:DNA-binding IclR family transcriptional regulator